MARAVAARRARRAAEKIPRASRRCSKRHGKRCASVWTGDVTAASSRDARAVATKGPLVAGVELSATVARVIVATRENARLRITGRGEAGLAEGAVVGGLVLSGAAMGALETARHRGAIVPGAYALGRLLTESGVLDAGVLRLGADVTSLAVLREGRVVATRAFGLGRIAIMSRPDRLESDARVWADCVIASLHTLDGLPPARWLFVGVPDSLAALPRALGEAVSGVRGGAVDVAPLSVGIASRAYSDVTLRADDLVAVGAAAIASGIFAS